MDGVVADFEKRVAETELYFQFLLEMLDDETRMSVRREGVSELRPVDNEMQKILKANTFLLLYNLVESTIRMSIEELFGKIDQEELTFQDLSEELRAIYVVHSLKSVEKNIGSIERYRKAARDLVDSVVSKTVAHIEIDSLPVSGNLDARQIRKIAKMLGFSAAVQRHAKGGEKLLTIKDMRNSLAHGALSFTECGRQFGPNELVEMKAQVILYLSSIMKNVEKYIDEKRYAA